MPLTAAIVGCGRMGRRHADVLSKISIKIVGLVDLDPAVCEKFIGAFPAPDRPSCYHSLDSLLEANAPDLVVVSTTAGAHVSHALQSIEAGVGLILLEKPVATSMAQCLELQQACERTKARVAVNHQMRFLPQYQIPKRLLSSPGYAGFRSMHVAAGNFGMAMNGTHYFEAFRFLTDEAPVKVEAWFDSDILPNPRGPQFHDVSGCIRVTTASCHRLYIDASSDQGHGVQVTYMGRNGRISIDELTGSMTAVVRTAEHRDAPTSRYGMPVEVEHHQIPPVELVDSTMAVLQALLAGDGYPTLADATLAVKTLIASYHSHRMGGLPVALADIPDDDLEVFPWA